MDCENRQEGSGEYVAEVPPLPLEPPLLEPPEEVEAPPPHAQQITVASYPIFLKLKAVEHQPGDEV